jgi:hypothetical protein
MPIRNVWSACAVAVLVAAAGPALAACDLPFEQVEGLFARPDGTIRLNDRRDIKLAGVQLTPEGLAALPGLIDGKQLTIRPLGKPDRWNRQPAHIDDLETKLIASGLGHAAAQAEGACLTPLLAAEEKGRKDKAGIWGKDDYALKAADGAALTARLGQHVLVEGTVDSARTSQGRVYLNFARYWKSGLSLIIAEKDWPFFAKGATVEAMAGKRLRVRGRLEYRSGPAILIGPDDRIEILR